MKKQEEFLHSNDSEKLLTYWKNELSGSITKLDLTFDKPRPENNSTGGSMVYTDIDIELTNKLRAYARSEGVTLYNLLLSVYLILLNKYCNQDDILVGTTTAGRNISDTKNIAGYFVNPVVIRAKPNVVMDVPSTRPGASPARSSGASATTRRPARVPMAHAPRRRGQVAAPSRARRGPLKAAMARPWCTRRPSTTPVPGEYDTVDTARIGGNLYAGGDGNVYRNTGEMVGSNATGAVGSRPAAIPPGRDREQQARTQAANRFGGVGDGGFGDRFGGGAASERRRLWRWRF